MKICVNGFNVIANKAIDTCFMQYCC